jgi:RNA polymerase sigma factor (sigma-70 family)
VTGAGMPDGAAPGSQARLALSSFPEFYRQFWPRLVRCLIAQATDTRWAEDVAQDTMLSALEKWDQLLTYDRPDAWLFKVGIRRLRRTEAKGREQCLLPDEESAAGDLAVAAAMDGWISEHIDLITAIRSLPRRQAEVIVVHSLADYTIAETAGILGMCEATAKTHLKRARERLHELLHHDAPGLPESPRKMPT